MLIRNFLGGRDMKEFEKWWEGLEFPSVGKHPLNADDYYNHMAPYNIAEDVWKAALEWILSTACPGSYGEEAIDGADIRKELEE